MAVPRGVIQILTKQFGNTEINRAIAQLRRRVDYIRPILEDIGQLQVNDAVARIHKQHSPQRKRWRDNSPVTQKYKQRGMKIGESYRGPAVEGPNKRLVWTSSLRGSLKFRVSGNTVIVVADVPYATTQQWGAKKGDFGKFTMKGVDRVTPWGDIPARRFLGTNQRLNEKVLKILGDYMLGNEVAKDLGFSS